MAFCPSSEQRKARSSWLSIKRFSVRTAGHWAKGVLFIPTDAVRTIGGRTAVYVQNSDGMREIRYIEIGLSVKGLPEKSLNRTEVISGLSEGEIIIIR